MTLLTENALLIIVFFSTNRAILNIIHFALATIKNKNDLIISGKTFGEFHKFKYILQ